MKEGTPKKVLDAIRSGDTEAHHRMAVAGAKASAETRKSNALWNELRASDALEAKRIQKKDALEAERLHNMSSEGDILPPEEENQA